MAPKYTNKLQGKSVLIVGGSSGIGYAIAEACVEFEAHVTIASRNQEKVSSAIKRLTASYPDAKDRIRGHVVDLYGEDTEESLVKLFRFATEDGEKKVDHVVETAGEPHNSSTFQSATPETFIESSRTRVFGVAMLAKVAAEYLRQAPSSSLSLTGGTSAYKPMPGWVIQSCIGGAKDGLTRGLAVEMSPVRVNLVSPGPVQTELFENAIKTFGNDPEAVQDMLRKASLLGTIGHPEDLAEAYLSLMKNAFITGTTLHVEGGFFLK